MWHLQCKHKIHGAVAMIAPVVLQFDSQEQGEATLARYERSEGMRHLWFRLVKIDSQGYVTQTSKEWPET
jgi:hypothetical protein